MGDPNLHYHVNGVTSPGGVYLCYIVRDEKTASVLFENLLLLMRALNDGVKSVMSEEKLTNDIAYSKCTFGTGDGSRAYAAKRKCDADCAFSQMYEIPEILKTGLEIEKPDPKNTVLKIPGVNFIDITKHMSFNASTALAYLWTSKEGNESSKLKMALFHLGQEEERLSKSAKVEPAVTFPPEVHKIAGHFSYNVGCAINYLLFSSIHDDPILDLVQAMVHCTREIDKLEKEKK